MNKKSISFYQWKLSLGALYLFSFTLPFSLKISNVLLALTAALLIIRKDYLKDLKNALRDGTALSLFGLFLMYAVSFLWSDNKSHAGFVLEKHLSLLIIPLMTYPALHYLKSHVKYILLSFVAGILIAYGWIFALYFLHHMHQSDIEHYFREIVMGYVELHPTYLAIYTIFTMLIIADGFNFNDSILKKALTAILLLILLIFTLLTGARMPLLALFSIVIFTASFSLLKLRHGWIYTMGLLICASIVGYFSIQIPVLKNRISEITDTAFAPPIDIHFNSVNLRIAQFQCGKEVIQRHWLLGVGIGDTQDQLNACYNEHGWSPALYERNYNPHNQYIQTWLNSGILALLLLLAGIFGPVLWGKTNRLHIMLIVLFAICCLTESLLEKNKGIVFFIFFTTLLSQYQRSIRKT